MPRPRTTATSESSLDPEQARTPNPSAWVLTTDSAAETISATPKPSGEAEVLELQQDEVQLLAGKVEDRAHGVAAG